MPCPARSRHRRRRSRLPAGRSSRAPAAGSHPPARRRPSGNCLRPCIRESGRNRHRTARRPFRNIRRCAFPPNPAPTDIGNSCSSTRARHRCPGRRHAPRAGRICRWPGRSKRCPMSPSRPATRAHNAR